MVKFGDETTKRLNKITENKKYLSGDDVREIISKTIDWDKCMLEFASHIDLMIDVVVETENKIIKKHSEGFNGGKKVVMVYDYN